MAAEIVVGAAEFRCRVCGVRGGGPAKFVAREMMLGTLDTFEYLQCRSCESLQLAREISSHEIGRYYPIAYYSFQNEPKTAVRTWLRAQRDAAVHGGDAVVDVTADGAACAKG